MLGKYDIVVSTKKVTYKLEVKRNITIIQGDSATGKSTLIDLISQYNRLGASSGVSVVCEKECIAVLGLDGQSDIRNSSERIFFLDENNSFIYTKEFAQIVSGSDNYFVIIARDSLPQLAYSIDEIYGMREDRKSQKYIEARHIYNEIYNLYDSAYSEDRFAPELVITEDSNSGYDFFSEIYKNMCISANGKSNISILSRKKEFADKKILIIVDGAAFGSDINELLRSTLDREVYVYAPESFEYLVLLSKIVPVNQEMLEHTYDYADSKYYLSWERFYTEILKNNSSGTIYQYTKRNLNKTYLTQGNIKKIKENMPKAIL